MADAMTIQKIKTPDGVEHPIDALTLDGNSPETYQEVSNLVQSVSSSSTTTEYPSAKCVYEMVKDINDTLATI